jgi:hypothetical protein
MPAVSVIMVFHRDTRFFRPAIASVLRQTFSEFEFVLVDNGTGLHAGDLGELGHDARLRWVRLPRNAGIPAGHNAGVAAATGEFIALVDYDDVLVPTRLEREVAALKADSSVGLVSARAERIDENGRAIGHEFCLGDPSEHFIYAPYAAPIITPAAMGRREIFSAFPYRVEFPFAADLDFQARVVERWRMIVLPEVLLKYRWYSEQTTQQRRASIEQSRSAIQVVAGRRRAGRPENLAAVVDAVATRDAATAWRKGAALCLADGAAVFAAFQARRSFVLDRSGSGAWQALRLAGRAWRQARDQERTLVRRMFFTGPVRALKLHPAGRETAVRAVASESTAPAAPW